MNIPINLFTWVSAFLPILLLIIFLMILNMSASKASIITVIVTLITSLIVFKANGKLLLVESLKGAWNALSIILIIWSAIFVYKVGEKSNAFLVIRDKIKKTMPNELLVIYTFGWVLVSFLQGITGFGVPVAVGAPLLLGIGVNPIYAVVIPLLGQSFGNTFGTLAAAWDSLMLTAGVEVGSGLYNSTALWTALFLLIWNVIIGLIISWYYGKFEAIKKGLPAIFLISGIQGIGQILLSQVNTTLANFIPALISFAAIIVLSKSRMYNEFWRINNSYIMDSASLNNGKDISDTSDMNLTEAFLPYIVLSVLTIIVLAITPINNLLSQIQISFSVPETSTSYGHVNSAVSQFSPIRPFTHASFFLICSGLTGMFYYIIKNKLKSEDRTDIIKETTNLTIPSATSVLALVIMSNIMSGTGQTQVLAYGIVNTLNTGFLFLAPLIGLIGTFITGSNMSSNILFGNFQSTAAELVGADKAIVLAAQTVGGAIGAAISPSKVILGTTTANISGKEGVVMKKIMPPVIVFAILVGIFLKIMS